MTSLSSIVWVEVLYPIPKALNEYFILVPYKVVFSEGRVSSPGVFHSYPR